jgi:hypothetical protein
VVVERLSICIQETKLDVVSDFDVIQLVGLGFEYVDLPANHTHGGILVAWRPSSLVVLNSSTRSFSVSIRLRHAAGGPKWWLTSIYDPAADADKDAFLAELHDMRQVRTGPWMLNGDFNLIYRAEDKNYDRLNQRCMGQFCQFLNDAMLQEIHLNRRLFTWSNEQSYPTLECIDRVFISNKWDDIFQDHVLHSLSTLCSDHEPLLLRT